MELIGRLLKMATNSLNQEFNRFAQQYDLTGTQMSVIDFMANCESQECDQHMLEREFNIKRSTTTVIIQRLVKKGLIEQRQSVTDRRQKVVTLTAKGRDLAPTVRDYILASEERLRTNFTAEELRKFKEILKFIIGEDEDNDQK